MGDLSGVALPQENGSPKGQTLQFNMKDALCIFFTFLPFINILYDVTLKGK